MKFKLSFALYIVTIVGLALLLTRPKPTSAFKPSPALSNTGSLCTLRAADDKFLHSKTPSLGLTYLDYHTVAHALGSIDDKRATNCLDAMVANYNQGMRVFETDLILTSDGVLVNRHDWLPYLYYMLKQNIDADKRLAPLTYNEFKNLKAYGKYQPLDFSTLAQILKIHKDIYIITDTKSMDKDTFSKQITYIVNTAKKVDPSILDRVVIQIYNENMYSWVNNIYPFKNILYSTYMSPINSKDIISFCQEKHIPAVTLASDQVNVQIVDELYRNNIKVFVQTVNDEDQRSIYKSMGAWGVYSDFLTGN